MASDSDAKRNVITNFALLFLILIILASVWGVYKTAEEDVQTGGGDAGSQSGESIGDAFSGMIVLTLVLLGGFLAFTTAGSFLKSPDSAEALQHIRYSADKFPKVAAVGGKMGWKGLTTAGAAATATAAKIRETPPSAVYWREEFQGPKGEKKLKAFLDPAQTKSRTFKYHEPGAAAVGAAVLSMGRKPGFEFVQKDHTLDAYSYQQQKELAERAQQMEAEEQYWAERRAENGMGDTGGAPPSVNITIAHQNQTNPIQSFVAQTSSPPAVFGGVFAFWMALVLTVVPSMEPISQTVFQVGGAAILGLFIYFGMSDAGYAFPASIFVGLVSGVMLFTLAATFSE